MKTVTLIALMAGLISGMAFAEEAETTVDSGAVVKPDYSSLVFRVFEQSQPKPMGIIPEGWKLTLIDGQKTEHPPIKLPNGKETTIKTTPYVIVPEAGKYILDPGFDAMKGNAQEDTLGAVLTAYSEESKALSNKLDALIEAFQAALNGAPEPEVKKAAKN